MTSSNLVGCWTGRSPGLSPRRIRSTAAGLLLQRLQHQRGGGQDHVRPQVHELDRIGPNALGVGGAPAIVRTCRSAICYVALAIFIPGGGLPADVPGTSFAPTMSMRPMRSYSLHTLPSQ